MASLLERESSFCDREQQNAIVRALYNQKKTSMFCDVTMKVCSKEIFAHSVILAAASPYFNTFLTQDLPRQFSQRSPQVIEIQIDGSEPSVLYEEAVSTVVDFIYTGIMVLRNSNVAQISEIARIMQMENVVRYCEDFLLGGNHSNAPAGGDDSTAPPINTANVGVNTGHMLGGTQSVLVSPVVSQAALAKLYKPGKRVSISTQVTPTLLGIHPPAPKETKETKTQTSDRDFPEKIKQEKTSSQSSRGQRKPCRVGVSANVGTGGDTEVVMEITRGTGTGKRKSTSIRILKDNKPSESLGLNKGEHLGKDCGSPRPTVGLIGEVDEAENSHATETESEEQSDFHIGSDCGSRRRSGRKPKPTAKLLAMKRKSSVSPKGQFIKSKVIQEEEEVTKADDQDEVSKPDISDTQTLTEEVNIVALNEDETTNHDNTNMELEEEDKQTVQTKEVLEEKTEAAATSGSIHEGQEENSRPQPVRLKRGRRKKIGYRRGRRGISVPKFTCPDCGFKTNKVREFGNHKRLHKLEQNICYYCERKFESRETLNDHLERHKGPQPFFCMVCDCRFKSRTQLNLHLPKHSDDKPFVCEVCNVGFKWKHALKNHMIVHSNRKDHLCDECGYATAHKCQLKAHKLIHTGQTFRCPFAGCSFQATKRQNLKYHMLVHTREKPHQCEICGQSFSLVKNMRRHMLLHSSDKPHQCDQCDFSTTRFDKLKEHMLKLHGMGSPPEKRVRIADLVQQNYIDVILDSEELPGDQPDGTTEVVVQAPEASCVHREETPNTAANTITMRTEDFLRAAGANEEVTVMGEAQPIEFLPGQTIIITQPTGQDGEVQTHEITMPTQNGLLDANSNEQFQTIQYAEVMIPASQMAEYVQQVAFVTQ